MSVNESKTLNEHFNNSEYNSESMAKLEQLKNLGLDPEVIAQFEGRIMEILDKNPGSEEIVNNELDKTTIGVTVAENTYTRQFRSILSANNPDYNPDEDLLGYDNFGNS